MILEITNGFGSLPEGLLETRGIDITTAMTGNPSFPGPVPVLDAAKAALTAYSAARTAATSGDRVAIAVKNQEKDKLIKALHDLAAYVLFVAKGDLAVALSSKFTVRRKPEPRPAMLSPEGFAMEPTGNPGELKFSVYKVKDARMYLFQYTTDEVITADTKWITISSSSCKVLAKNLTSRQGVWGRVVALGTKGQEMYCDPVYRMVQ